MNKALATIAALTAFAVSAVSAQNPAPNAIEQQILQLREGLEQLEELKTQAAEVEATQAQLAADPDLMAAEIVKLQEADAILASPTGDTADRPMLQRNIDQVWLIMAALLVFFMQAGFCMLEMGFARAKNSINVAMKNVLDFSAATICYLLFGFTIMFGASAGGWFGSGSSWLSSFSGDSPIWSFFLFQGVFAATACTIASGAMAERTKFLGYVIYTAIFAGLIYPIFGHWVWGSLAGGLEPGFGGSKGWLETMGVGFHDFAGSSVVHGIGGACALAGIIVVGARKDRFTADGEARMITGHNVPLAFLGGMILWLGWFGFNAGSTVTGNAELGRVCVNTVIAGSGGAFLAMILFWVLRGTPDFGVTINGILGGLVAVTAAADVVSPISALAIGAIAGLISTGGAIVIEKFRLDDVVGAVPVHLFNGVWGCLAVAFFHEAGFSMARLGVQAFGVVAVCGGAFIVALVLFKAIDTFVGLRANEEEQEDGLDFSEHAANAYPDFHTAER